MSHADTVNRAKLLRRYRMVLGAFAIALVLSGATAFPLRWELDLLTRLLGVAPNAQPERLSGLVEWLVRVRNALRATDLKYPFLAYGYDWLAFAHLVIALAYVGPYRDYRDPVRNRWVLEWGMICCVAVFPLAFICGPLRGIPLYWQLIDCCFGVFGLPPLYLCWKWSKELEGVKESQNASTSL